MTFFWFVTEDDGRIIFSCAMISAATEDEQKIRLLTLASKQWELPARYTQAPALRLRNGLNIKGIIGSY